MVYSLRVGAILVKGLNFRNLLESRHKIVYKDNDNIFLNLIIEKEF